MFGETENVRVNHRRGSRLGIEGHCIHDPLSGLFLLDAKVPESLLGVCAVNQGYAEFQCRALFGGPIDGGPKAFDV